MNTFLLILIAIAPSVAIILFIYFKDKYEKEPVSLLIKSFLLGILSIIPPIIIENVSAYLGIYISENILITAVYAFLIVGGSEELSKFIVLRYYSFKHKKFTEPYDGIVYSVVISMGFATVENIYIVIKGGIETALIRMFTAIPAHAIFAIFMGYFIGLARFKRHKFAYLTISLLCAVVTHGIYDFFLMQQYYPLLGLLSLILLIVGIRLSFIAIKIHNRLSPYRKDIRR